MLNVQPALEHPDEETTTKMNKQKETRLHVDKCFSDGKWFSELADRDKKQRNNNQVVICNSDA